MLIKTDDFALERIPAPLLLWYREHKRDLPWRREVTPYTVWVSEIMLQQTRVEAAKEYFLRFMQALPTVQDLAYCEEEKLLKLWELILQNFRKQSLLQYILMKTENSGTASIRRSATAFMRLHFI